VLLDSEGHIKVTDFGLAKGNMADGERTNSFIGTMEYMAPEIIQGKGHGKDVDWWSVGILLFEMMTGMPPFNAKSRNQLQKQITGGKLKYPCKHLLSAKTPSKSPKTKKQMICAPWHLLLLGSEQISQRQARYDIPTAVFAQSLLLWLLLLCSGHFGGICWAFQNSSELCCSVSEPQCTELAEGPACTGC